jgi:hypothetical protein
MDCNFQALNERIGALASTETWWGLIPSRRQIKNTNAWRDPINRI